MKITRTLFSVLVVLLAVIGATACEKGLTGGGGAAQLRGAPSNPAFASATAEADARQLNKATPQSVEEKDEKVICGTVALLQMTRQVVSGLWRDLTVVTFNDGRKITLQGLPEITVTKNKMYAFVVKKQPHTRGHYELVKTSAANSCGYDKAK